MTPRFAQTLRLAAQGAERTQGAEPGGPAGLRLSLADLLHMHGEASGPVVLMLLAVLATLPVAGAGMVLSLGLFLMAWAWVQGREHTPLPDRLGRLTLNATWSRRCLHGLAWMYEQADRWMRPRCTQLCHARFRAPWGAWIGLMAALIFIPLPLGNVLPAISLVLLALGWMFRDGLALVAAVFAGVAAVAYAASLSHLAVNMLQDVWMRLPV